MPARQYYTAEMVRNMPDDGNRYETVYGELLVSPAPGHSIRSSVLAFSRGFSGTSTRTLGQWCCTRPPGAAAPLVLDLDTVLRA